MHNGESAKKYQEGNVQQNKMWCICKANVSHLDENIADLLK